MCDHNICMINEYANLSLQQLPLAVVPYYVKKTIFVLLGFFPSDHFYR